MGVVDDVGGRLRWPNPRDFRAYTLLLYCVPEVISTHYTTCNTHTNLSINGGTENVGLSPLKDEKFY